MYMFMADDISKSSNSLKAFEAATTVIRGLVDGSVRAFFSPRSFSLNNDLQVDFDDTVFDAAKSGIVYQVAKSVCTAEKAVRSIH